MDKFFHSVTLETELCKGCTNCIKRCPTEAIRVRNGKAQISTERCIDCGECIRVCPQHAKKAVFDPFESIEKYKYKIALPAPSLYGQFNNLDDINYVLSGLLSIGFDDVFEVSKAAEMISLITRNLISQGKVKTPVISSACPAVTRLIRVRFPDLCSNVLDMLPPVELAAIIARKQAMKKTGLKAEQIGVVFISPCPAKVTAVNMPIGISKSNIDVVLAIKDIYPRLVAAMNKLGNLHNLSESGIIGISWASSGGEASALLDEKYLAADGIENVIKVLEDIEDEKFSELHFIELNACHGGCVGGVMAVENPYVAKARIQRLRKYLPVSQSHAEDTKGLDDLVRWNLPLEYTPVLTLDENIVKAMEKLDEIEKIESLLPSLDCGACGAPSCKALAEDIVRGSAELADCVFIVREQMHELFHQLSQLEEYLPPPFRSVKGEEERNDSEEGK